MTRTPRFRREVAGGLETRVGGNGMKPNMRMVRYQQLATLLSATAERLSADSATFRAIVEHNHFMSCDCPTGSIYTGKHDPACRSEEMIDFVWDITESVLTKNQLVEFGLEAAWNAIFGEETE